MYDYAWVHVVYTIPLALLLSVVLAPLLTRLDIFKICFLITVAFSYTLPWDSYLVRHRIWTYPEEAVLGPSLFQVPIEELFFFVIQTYFTTCLHILLNKPVLTAVYLRNEAVCGGFAAQKYLGQLFFIACFVIPILLPGDHKEGTYLKLIVAWVAPIFLLLWSLAYQLLLTLPRSKTLLPMLLPTLFLWIVDTLALQRGTWSIESGTKLGIHIWPHLELEEALFFLVTNAMIVMGSVAFDNSIAILDAFPALFPTVPGIPPPMLMLRALFTPTSSYDDERIVGLQNALVVLAKKSRSFYLASGVFNGRLRIDLVLLYGFCRVADDMIDDAADAEEADTWTKHFTNFLDVAFSGKRREIELDDALKPFPEKAQTILRLLPTEHLPSEPLYSLLDGFRMDLKFSAKDGKENPPVQTEADLEQYATCVAATIGELCLSLVYAHDPDKALGNDPDERQECLAAGIRMGRVLQYINIVRDVTTDAETGRCYIPSEWFSAAPSTLSATEHSSEVLACRKRLLAIAFEGYRRNRDAIEYLPRYARSGIRVAVESYMEIGRVLRHRMDNGLPLDFAGGGKKGRASVPKLRRVWVGWRTMVGRRGDV